MSFLRHPIISLFSAAFVITCGDASYIKLPDGEVGFQVHTPMFAAHVGPAEFSVDHGPVLEVQLDELGRHVCDPYETSQGPLSKEATAFREQIRGRTVLVKYAFGELDAECGSQSRFFLSLADAGVRGIVLALSGGYDKLYAVAGYEYYMRPWDVGDAYATSRIIGVPVVGVNLADAKSILVLGSTLGGSSAARAAATNSSNGTTHATFVLEPNENTWVTMYKSWTWVLLFRLLQPAGFGSVFAIALCLLACGPSKLGSTKVWVLSLEAVTALIVCIGTAVGCTGFDNDTFPKQVHLFLMPRFPLCAILTTTLVARFWRNHYAVARSGLLARSRTDQESAIPTSVDLRDPQAVGWLPAGASALVVAFDVGMAAVTAYHPTTQLILLNGLLRFFGHAASGGYLLWISLNVLFLAKEETASQKEIRTMATYLSLSSGFIAIELLVSILIVAGFHRTPRQMLVIQFFMNTSRIGTALCQMAVFAPPSSYKRVRGASVVPACRRGQLNTPPCALNSELSPFSDQLQIQQRELDAARSSLAFMEEDRDVLIRELRARDTEREKLLCTLRTEKKSQGELLHDLGKAHRQIESRNNAMRVIQHTAKNAMLEAQSAMIFAVEDIESVIEKPPSVVLSAVHELRGAAGLLGHSLEVVHRSVQIAAIFEGVYDPIPTLVNDLSKWATRTAPGEPTVVLLGDAASPLKIMDYEVADLFRCLVFENIKAHGAADGPVVVRCDFKSKDAALYLDISNAIDSANGAEPGPGSKIKTRRCRRGRRLNTGIGLHDLKRVTELVKAPFTSEMGEDGLWHSAIQLRAVACELSPSAKTAAITRAYRKHQVKPTPASVPPARRPSKVLQSDGSKLGSRSGVDRNGQVKTTPVSIPPAKRPPEALQAADSKLGSRSGAMTTCVSTTTAGLVPKCAIVIDDMLSVLKMTGRTLRRGVPGLLVREYRLHNKATYSEFLEKTVAAEAGSWDLVLLDQNLVMSDDMLRYGTDILQRILDAAHSAGKVHPPCILMHTGNNAAVDVKSYLAKGANGVIGKGIPGFVNVVLEHFTKNRSGKGLASTLVANAGGSSEGRFPKTTNTKAL